jgi:outer membrane protein assembly factor BamB
MKPIRRSLIAACSLVAFAGLGHAAESVPPARTADWPSYLGPNHAFADTQTPPVRLLDDITQAKLVWRSEEGGIGFGKAYSGAMKGGFAKGSGLPASGAASPILAGGLVVQFYSLPRGPLAGNAPTEGPMKEFASFWSISADDVVIGIDAATGKTLWKRVFEDQGIGYGAGKRGEFAVTPCAADGRVFALGTAGRLYGLELATGKVLWQSNIGPVHEQIEAAKKVAIETRQPLKRTHAPYGQLLVVDGILLVPDWSAGVRGVDPASGKLLWAAGDKGGLTSRYNCPAPVVVDGKSYAVCVNRTGDLRLLDPRKGTLLWTHALGSMHLTQPVFGKELLIAFDTYRDPSSTDKRVAQGGLGVLAGYRLSLTGAQRVWQLDPKTYAAHLWPDAGPSRKIATRRDGIIYHGAHGGSTGKLAVVEEATGKVLNPPDDVAHYWCINLWGDRLFFQTDIQHGAHASWRVYDANPATFKLLGEAKFPSDAQRTCGYEVPLHEIYADGFVYIREWRDRWGGISCYDLRKPK